MHQDLSTDFFSRLYFSYTEAVTYGYVVNSFPYRNTVDIVELTGKDLTLVFEQVATLYDKNDPSNSFLQVSGNCVLFSSSLNIIWVNFNRKPGIASSMLSFALRLVQKTRAALSTNQMQNLKQPQLGHPRFPALLIVWYVSSSALIGHCVWSGFGLQELVDGREERSYMNAINFGC